MVDTIQSVTAVQGHDPDPSTVARVNRDNRPIPAPGKSTDAPKAAQGQPAVGQVGDISGMVAALNDLVYQVASTKITFDVDEATGHSVIRVLDKETGELIRQVPPEELLILAAKMKQLSGLIFSQEV